MLTNESIRDFVTILASDAPVPGGGGASALAGALGMALGSMVGSLTLRSKKYAANHEDIQNLKERAAALQDRLLDLVEEDAAAFEPLAAAYRIPKDDPTREAVMEQALYSASLPPLDIMQACVDCLALHQEFGVKGTQMAISDVGVGVAFCAAALQGASLNVFINTASMKDKERAKLLETKALTLLDSVHTADTIFAEVATQCANSLQGRQWHQP